MKLTRSDPFRLHLIEKDNLRTGETVNLTKLKSKWLIRFLMKAIFSMFQQAIKFDCLVLFFFSIFLLICKLYLTN